jgi:hypothetical protein
MPRVALFLYRRAIRRRATAASPPTRQSQPASARPGYGLSQGRQHARKTANMCADIRPRYAFSARGLAGLSLGAGELSPMLERRDRPYKPVAGTPRLHAPDHAREGGGCAHIRVEMSFQAPAPVAPDPLAPWRNGNRPRSPLSLAWIQSRLSARWPGASVRAIGREPTTIQQSSAICTTSPRLRRTSDGEGSGPRLPIRQQCSPTAAPVRSRCALGTGISGFRTGSIVRRAR